MQSKYFAAIIAALLAVFAGFGIISSTPDTVTVTTAPSAYPEVSPSASPSNPSPVPSASVAPVPLTSPSVVPTVTSTPLTATSSPSPTVAPTSTPTPGTIPRHVLTADYWLTIDPNKAAPYLTFEYPSSANYQVTHDAGIKTVAYMNPLMPDKTNTQVAQEYPLITGAYASAQAKDCSGNVILTYNQTGFLTNVYDYQVTVPYVQATVTNMESKAPDVLFFDNANDMYGTTAHPCNYTAASWTTALDKVLDSLPAQHVWLNTLAVGPVANQVAGLNSTNVDGGEYEHCFTDNAWVNAENAALQAHAIHKGFWCYANSANSSKAADTVLQERLFNYASFLLTYNPSTDIFQEWYATSSGFKVMPETGFVALSPAYGISTVSAAQYTGGVYERSYNECYYQGQSLGPCKIVVNPGSASTPVPYITGFTHSMVLHGSSILDGGSVTFDGTASQTLAPLTAEILIH